MGDKGHHTGMAGEFAVMEKLHRLGHQPALTLGNAKTVDIMTKSPIGKLFQISVKAIQGGGKWGIGQFDHSEEVGLVFVFLHYPKFSDLQSQPSVWVMPAEDVMRLRRPWLNGGYAIFCANKEQRDKIEQYRDRWDFLDGKPRVLKLGAPAGVGAEPAVLSFGGVLARGVAAMSGFHAKYGKWPVSLKMGNGSIRVLKEQHLTPHGLALLQSKVQLVPGDSERVYAHGDTKDEVFDYGSENLGAEQREDAYEWLGLR